MSCLCFLFQLTTLIIKSTDESEEGTILKEECCPGSPYIVFSVAECAESQPKQE